MSILKTYQRLNLESKEAKEIRTTTNKDKYNLQEKTAVVVI
jgi:hypothetical protein